MDYASLIERVYEHLENDDVEKAVMTCLRLARHDQDYLNAAVFLWELYPDKKQFTSIFYQDTAKLNREQQQFLWKRSVEIWMEGRAVETATLQRGNVSTEEKILASGAGQLDSELGQLERSIQDLAVPPGMAPFDVAAFTDRYTGQKSLIRLRIQNLQLVRQRIKTRCLNYAISLERQLEAQQKPVAFLQHVQAEVNNYFKARSEDVYLKLQKAAHLVDSADPEDYSVLLTHVRRAMNGVADYFYPPVSGVVVCSDGIERKLGEDKYLNRLQEYFATQFPPGSSTDLLRSELDVLMRFSRKLNDMSSKGVHTNVTAQEAKQGLVGLYMFLYNVIARLQGALEAKDSTVQTAS